LAHGTGKRKTILVRDDYIPGNLIGETYLREFNGTI
jgi:hypothetical protein